MAWMALLGGVAAGLVLAALQEVWVTPLIRVAESYEGAPSSGQPPNPAEDLAPTRLLRIDPHRLALTVLSDVLAGVGFALLLVAGMTLRGAPVSVPGGVLWGLAGYGVFVLAPALGLPPGLPGSAEAALEERQLWWIGTVVATALGLAVLAFAPRLFKVLGALLLIAPHVVGAPQPPLDAPELLPPALTARFVAAVLVTSAVFWAVLGAACARLGRRRV
jgi:cobalt transporter subunit CbtA